MLSEAPWRLPEGGAGGRREWRLLETSGGFWRLLEAPGGAIGGSWRLLETPGRFCLEASGGFGRLLEASEGFWRLLEASGGSWRLLEAP